MPVIQTVDQTSILGIGRALSLVILYKMAYHLGWNGASETIPPLPVTNKTFFLQMDLQNIACKYM